MPSSYVTIPQPSRPSGEDERPVQPPATSEEQRTLSGSTVRNASSIEGEAVADDGKDPAHGQEQAQGGSDEQSPLLSPSGSEQDVFIDGPPAAQPDETQTTKSFLYIILLTISIGGLQIAWAVELSNGSPYLLSLGLSKSLMALVWIAGPLSGTLVQPYVGMLSDNCRIPWGKRKPFMVGGTLATMASLMILAWTKEMVGGTLSLFGADPTSEGVKVCIIVVAVIWVYILDFAINAVQAAIRALMVDCAPAHQQEAVNAMASRIVGIGNIIGYLAGYTDLPKYAWWLGDTQFKDLCAIASLSLGATILLTCLTIRERDPRLDGPPPKDSKAGLITFFRSIFISIRRLPPQIKKVCIVQFCAWIGFFPMLFYTSSYIGEIYAEPYLEENPNMTDEELDRLYEAATRVGTFALLIFSITSLITNLFLPFFIAPTYDNQHIMVAEAPGEGPAIASTHGDGDAEQKSWLQYLVIPGFTLRRAWMYSQLLFTASMLCTVFVRTVTVATILIGLVGITWALTLWAPWAIISAEISRRDALMRLRKQAAFYVSNNNGAHDPPSLDGYSDQDGDVTVPEEGEEEEEDADQAGVILGIHNMAIAAPQIIATVGSSIIFRFFQKKRGEPGDHSIAIVMALGGLTVLVSAWFIHRIREDVSLPADIVAAAEEGDVGQPLSRPSTSHSGTQSPQMPRRSLERATLVRNRSFGGSEY